MNDEKDQDQDESPIGALLEIAADLEASGSEGSKELADRVRAAAAKGFAAAEAAGEDTDAGRDRPASDGVKSPPAPPAAPPAVVKDKLVPTAPIARVGARGRGMLVPRDMNEAMQVAKLMSAAHGMVGAHLIGNPGGCLGVVLQAMTWGMSPYAVAQKTYVARMPDKNTDPMPPINYEAQLIHAVVLSLAPLDGRLSIAFEGKGDDMRCIVSGKFKGDAQASSLTSETISALKPEKNQYGKVKGSPLWEKKPQQQLAYNTVRDWARRYCPDIILGVYTPDEMQDFEIIPPTPIVDPFAGEGPKQLPRGDSSLRVEPAGTDGPKEPVPATSHSKE